MKLVKKCLIEFNNKRTNKITKIEVDDDEKLRFTLLDMQKFAKHYHKKQLLLHNVGGSLSSNNKTRLIEWKELNLLPIRVQNILIMIYEYNYKNDIVIYLEDLKWQEFKRYRQAGKWSWAKFQDMRGY